MSGPRVTECGAVLDSSKVSQESGAQGLVHMTSSDGAITTLAFPYGPFLRCSECSSSYPCLFNMHIHYTTLNVHRSSLFLRNTSKSCTEIHLLMKDVSLHLTDTVLSSSILVENFLFTRCSDTTMIVTAYENKQIHTTFI